MTYHQMRLLFAGLARYDGRLSVLVARDHGPVGLWTVVLRDHVRHTWLGMRRIEQLAPEAQGTAPLVAWEHPLTELALAEPEGAAMTWPQVLWALGALEHSAQGWSVVAMKHRGPPAQSAPALVRWFIWYWRQRRRAAGGLKVVGTDHRRPRDDGGRPAA